jgi:4-hydroxy-3-polyprenylbenzoate decarboxylase
MNIIVIAITGASGIRFGIELVKNIQKYKKVHLIISDNAKKVAKIEKIDDLQDVCKSVTYYEETELSSPIASGTYDFESMVVLPCSIKTLSGIANSYSENLIIRAADVALKEKRKLILCVRETPLHEGHIKLMLKCARYGAIICPVIPSFYNHPLTIDDMIKQYTGRICSLLSVKNDDFNRWNGEG